MKTKHDSLLRYYVWPLMKVVVLLSAGFTAYSILRQMAENNAKKLTPMRHSDDIRERSASTPSVNLYYKLFGGYNGYGAFPGADGGTILVNYNNYGLDLPDGSVAAITLHDSEGTFQSGYGISSPYALAFGGACNSADGGMILTPGNAYRSPLSLPLLTKLELGTNISVSWSKGFQVETSGNLTYLGESSLSCSPDGGTVLVNGLYGSGSLSWLVSKLDVNGNVVFSRAYNPGAYVGTPSTGLSLVCTYVSPTQEIFIASYTQPFVSTDFPLLILMKIGSDGRMVWANSWDISNGATEVDSAYPNSVAPTDDGGLIVSASVDSSRGYNGFVMKFNATDGNLLFTTLVPGNEVALGILDFVLQTSDQGFMGAGANLGNTLILYKFFSNGSYAWSSGLSGGSNWIPERIGAGYVNDTDGGLIFGGFVTGASPTSNTLDFLPSYLVKVSGFSEGFPSCAYNTTSGYIPPIGVVNPISASLDASFLGDISLSVTDYTHNVTIVPTTLTEETLCAVTIPGDEGGGSDNASRRNSPSLLAFLAPLAIGFASLSSGKEEHTKRDRKPPVPSALSFSVSP